MGGYFNPRTPVGCDSVRGVSGVRILISIHAPQWGATYPFLRPASMRLFQSTHPSGVRLKLDDGVNLIIGISIHAPQWGATWINLCRQSLSRFQSTHPSGVRPLGLCQTVTPFSFQSTHPSGVRPISETPTTTGTKFQSTHPSGVRPPLESIGHFDIEFQSTHPSGVRHTPMRTMWRLC